MPSSLSVLLSLALAIAQMLLPKDVLSAQEESSSSFLVFCTSVIFLHVMTTSSSLGYAGLVLPHHTDPTSPLLYLSELQGTWFVTVSPIAMNLGVFLRWLELIWQDLVNIPIIFPQHPPL